MKAIRFGSALSAIALAAVVSGCAAPRLGLTSKGPDLSKVGLATRAQAALAAQDYSSAVTYAEQAVEKTPRDAAFRALLGNSYFAAGRFASAEAAYRDSLSVGSNQPQVVLKLALVQIAQGKSGEARAFLDAARGSLEAADYGLALALAGYVPEAVSVLEAAAREPAADSRLRQNLALAYGLSGDWNAARVVAAQDLPADVVDVRVRQWMAFSKPAAAHDQVAALIGVVPAASDPGQPVRLALRAEGERQAVAAPSVSVATPAPVVAEAAAVDPLSAGSTPVEAVAVAEVAPQPPMAAALPPAPVVEHQSAPAKPRVRAAAYVPKAAPVRRASLPTLAGKSGAVVQLGAYGSPQRVAAAWDQAAKKFSALRSYSPMSARFQSPRGTVYRLSVTGFGSAREAVGLCASLRRSGGNCFVRSVAGDAPVRIASR